MCLRKLVSMRVYILVSVCVCVHTRTHTRVCLCTCVCVCSLLLDNTNLKDQKLFCSTGWVDLHRPVLCVHVCVCVCTHGRVCVQVCTFCVYVLGRYEHTHSHRTHIQTHTHIHIGTHTHTHTRWFLNNTLHNNCVWVCVHVFKCVCLYTNTLTYT